MKSSKLLMMSTVALLAGTLAAASQSIQPGSAQDKGASQGQMSQPSKEQAAPNRNAQSNEGTRGQAQSKEPTSGQAKSKESTTTGQATGGREENRAQRDQDKSPQGQTQREQDRRGAQTQGQAPREEDRQQGQMQRNQDQQRQGQTQRDQERNQQGQTQRDQGRTQEGQREGERSGGGSVSFTAEQRTKIRDVVFKESNAPRVSKVDFSLNVGTVVPRTVRVVEVPDVIVQVHPQWRGYRYFIVNEQLVIVEPNTLKIVAIVDV
jgi:hypothetical protein